MKDLTVTLTLKIPAKPGEPDPATRLRQLLKIALRAFGIHAEWADPAGTGGDGDRHDDDEARAGTSGAATGAGDQGDARPNLNHQHTRNPKGSAPR